MTTINTILIENSKRCTEVIKEINIFLSKMSSYKDPKDEYERRIQQNAEFLLDIPNFGILDAKIYNDISNLFQRVITLKENNDPNVTVLNSLYEILRYVLNWILTIIENEILVK